MKREFLEGLNLDKETVDKIMSENGKDIEKEKSKTTKAETERDTYKTQLDEVNSKLKDFEDMDIEAIKKEAKDWKEKYDNDTKELQDKLQAQAYDTAAKEYLGQFKFVDDDVKELVLNKFKSKEFKLDEGKFLGADDFMKEYQEAHKNLFVQEEKADPVPEIIRPTGGNGNEGEKMSLMDAMKYANEHPGTNISDLI